LAAGQLYQISSLSVSGPCNTWTYSWVNKDPPDWNCVQLGIAGGSTYDPNCYYNGTASSFSVPTSDILANGWLPTGSPTWQLTAETGGNTYVKTSSIGSF